jgi:hypothetical protein
MQKKVCFGFIALLSLVLVLPLSLHAAVVGHFTKVRGQVDVLKGGKIPAVAVKVRDGVEPGDVIRTKSKAKAELTMVDNSVIFMSPESRLAVADYVYNPAKNERRAVVRLFRGLIHTVVKHIAKSEQPDFILETHTATLGVRGTDWYTLLAPSFTSVYLVQGTLGVRSNLTTVPAMLLLHSMQFTRILRGQAPVPGKPMNMELVRSLHRMMDVGWKADGLGPHGDNLPEGSQNLQIPGFPRTQEQHMRQQYIPPVLQPQQQTPAPSHSPSPYP